MAQEAKKRNHSIIRIPLFFCVGWGSQVASSFTTVNCFGEFPNFFIDPIGNFDFSLCDGCYDIEDMEKHDACKEKNCGDLMLEGYFTGKTHTLDSEHCSYCSSEEFYVLRSKPLEKATSSLYSLALPAGAGKLQKAIITDGPEYGVMVTNFFRQDSKSLEKAEILLKKLQDLGYSNAEIADSRSIATLWCCSYVVIVDTAESKKQAKELKKKLKDQKIQGVTIRKLY